MANRAEKTCLYVIHPWANALALPGSIRNLLTLARKLKEKGVYIACESYTTQVVFDFYDIADLNLLVKVKDTRALAEAAQSRQELRRSKYGISEGGESTGYGSWRPEHDISPEEDYKRTYKEEFDPYKEETLKDIYRDFKDVGEWGELKMDGSHRKMSRRNKKRIKNDIKARETVSFKKSEQIEGEVADFLLDKLENLDPEIEGILIAGGFWSDCIDWNLTILENSKPKIRVLTNYVVKDKGESLEDYLKTNPPSFRKGDFRYVDLDLKELLKKF